MPASGLARLTDKQVGLVEPLVILWLAQHPGNLDEPCVVQQFRQAFG